MYRLPLWLLRAGAIPLAIVVNAALSGSASAHVKWFCGFNVAGQPRGLMDKLLARFLEAYGSPNYVRNSCDGIAKAVLLTQGIDTQDLVLQVRK